MASGKLVITAANRGPLINIPSWILLVVMCLTALGKIFSKWFMVRRLQSDDVYMFAAMIVTVGFGIAVSAQVAAGLGQHQSALDSAQLAHFEQAAYASQMLYVISLCLARMTLLQFLVYLARNNFRRSVVIGVMFFSCLFTVIAILCIAFQCALPHPWAVLGKCFDQQAFWIAFGVMDMAADIATILSSIFLLYDLHIDREQKFPIIGAFGARVIMIPLVIGRLVFLHAHTQSRDHAYDDFGLTMTTVVHVNLSVIVSCTPFLKPVMDSLQTGVLASHLRPRHLPLDKLSARKAGSAIDRPPINYTATASSSANDDPRSAPESAEKMVIQKQTTVAVHYGT